MADVAKPQSLQAVVTRTEQARNAAIVSESGARVQRQLADVARGQATSAEAVVVAAAALMAAGSIYDSVATVADLGSQPAVGDRLRLVVATGEAYAYAAGGPGGGYSWQYRGTPLQVPASSRAAATVRHGGPGRTLDVAGYGPTRWAEMTPFAPYTYKPGFPAANGGLWLHADYESGTQRAEWYHDIASEPDPLVVSSVLTAVGFAAQRRGDNMAVAPGAYVVDATQNSLIAAEVGSPAQTFGGFQVTGDWQGKELDLSGVTFLTGAHSSTHSSTLAFVRAKNLRVTGGHVIGGRRQGGFAHPGAEFGHGVVLHGTDNITFTGLRSDLNWGDGCQISIFNALVQRVRFYDCHFDGNYRNGRSWEGVTDGLSVGCSCTNTNGTGPGAGDDLESSNPIGNTNIRFVAHTGHGNWNADIELFGEAAVNADVTLVGCNLGSGKGLYLGGHVDGFRWIGGSCGSDSHTGPLNHIAMAVDSTSHLKGCYISGVTFRGPSPLYLETQTAEVQDLVLDGCTFDVSSGHGDTPVKADVPGLRIVGGALSVREGAGPANGAYVALLNAVTVSGGFRIAARGAGRLLRVEPLAAVVQDTIHLSGIAWGAGAASATVQPATVAAARVAVGGPGGPAFQSTWQNQADFSGLTFYRSGGRVYLDGYIGGGAPGSAVFFLPAGYQPTARHLLATRDEAGPATLDIRPDGAVVALSVPAPSSLLFGGLSFPLG